MHLSLTMLDRSCLVHCPSIFLYDIHELIFMSSRTNFPEGGRLVARLMVEAGANLVALLLLAVAVAR
jgi:hypothetical protein